MLYVKAETRMSQIEGRGLFILEPVKKGHVIANLGQGALVLPEKTYLKAQRHRNPLILETGVRWVGPYFLYNAVIDLEDYINHSCKPTMLYHCGLCFAKRNLPVGTELTVLKSAKELIMLFREISDIS